MTQVTYLKNYRLILFATRQSVHLPGCQGHSRSFEAHSINWQFTVKQYIMLPGEFFSVSFGWESFLNILSWRFTITEEFVLAWKYNLGKR
jgi:hypothetical protein